MVKRSKNESVKPVVTGVSYFLAHVPSLVRHGSKASGSNPDGLCPFGLKMS